MRTHDIGPFFWHNIRLTKEAPLIHSAETWETEEPYRSSKVIIFKLTATRGVVMGWWHETGHDQWEQLADAIGVRELTEHDAAFKNVQP